MRVSAYFAAFGLVLAAGGLARADDLFVSFESRSGAQNIGAVAAADTLTILGEVRRPPGAISHGVVFKSLSSSLTINVNWRSGAAGDAFRLVGVNLDLIDAGGMVVASDLFQGVLNGYATSTMSAAVTSGGTYRLQLTGTSQGVAIYNIVVAPGP